MNPASFFAGLATAAFLASALFFLKFYRASRDLFFLYFAWACVLLAAERILLLIVLPPNFINMRPPEAQAWVYLVRMAAYIMIIWAVIQRNRAGRLN